MLVIRADQMSVLGQSRFRQFQDRMSAHIAARFPGKAFTKDDRTLGEFALQSIRIAKTFGLEQEYDLRRFIEFRAEYGEHFYLLDWAAAILNDPTLSPCGKMEQIDDYTLYVLR